MGKPMTFAEFQATGRDVEDLGAALSDECLEGCPGRTYTANLYAERGDETLWQISTLYGQFRSNNLVELEARLYDFALSEAWIDPPPFGRDRLIHYIRKIGIGFHGDTDVFDYELPPEETAELSALLYAADEAGVDVNALALEVLGLAPSAAGTPDMDEAEALQIARARLFDAAAQHDTASPDGHSLRQALTVVERMIEARR